MTGKRYTASVLLLTIGCMIILSLVVLQWQNLTRLEILERVTPAIPSAADVQPSQVSTGFTLAPLSQYNEIIERPLFLPSRRPPIAESTPPDEPESIESSAFTLLGVAVTPERMLALLQVNKAGKVVRLDVGEEVEGWELQTVRKDSVILRSGERTEELPLKPKSSKSRSNALRVRGSDPKKDHPEGSTVSKPEGSTILRRTQRLQQQRFQRLQRR